MGTNISSVTRDFALVEVIASSTRYTFVPVLKNKT